MEGTIAAVNTTYIFVGAYSIYAFIIGYFGQTGDDADFQQTFDISPENITSQVLGKLIFLFSLIWKYGSTNMPEIIYVQGLNILLEHSAFDPNVILQWPDEALEIFRTINTGVRDPSDETYNGGSLLKMAAILDINILFHRICSCAGINFDFVCWDGVNIFMFVYHCAGYFISSRFHFFRYLLSNHFSPAVLEFCGETHSSIDNTCYGTIIHMAVHFNDIDLFRYVSTILLIDTASVIHLLTLKDGTNVDIVSMILIHQRIDFIKLLLANPIAHAALLSVMANGGTRKIPSSGIFYRRCIDNDGKYAPIGESEQSCYLQDLIRYSNDAPNSGDQAANILAYLFVHGFKIDPRYRDGNYNLLEIAIFYGVLPLVDMLLRMSVIDAETGLPSPMFDSYHALPYLLYLEGGGNPTQMDKINNYKLIGTLFEKEKNRKARLPLFQVCYGLKSHYSKEENWSLRRSMCTNGRVRNGAISVLSTVRVIRNVLEFIGYRPPEFDDDAAL